MQWKCNFNWNIVAIMNMLKLWKCEEKTAKKKNNEKEFNKEF